MIKNKIKEESLWTHKDGKTYKVVEVKRLHITGKWITMVAYIPLDEIPEEPYVRTEKHFLDSFTKKD